VEAGEALDRESRSRLRGKKGRRDQLIATFGSRNDVDVVYQDESWFSREKAPRLRSHSQRGGPQRLVERQLPRGDRPKAVAVFGATYVKNAANPDASSPPSGHTRVLCVNGQPNGERTWTFLRWLLRDAARRGKRWLLVIWDNASWHKCLRGWASAYNRDAARRGETRLMLFFLPTRSPWLNPIEPRWMQCKRAIYSEETTPTVHQLTQSIHDYFHQTNATLATRL
jgi:transposase